MCRFIKTGGNTKRTKVKEEDNRVGPVEEGKKRGRCKERQSRICRLYFPYQYREGSDPVQFSSLSLAAARLYRLPNKLWHSNPTRFNFLNPESNPICYLLALLGAHHFLHVSRIRVKLLSFRRLMSYIYIYIYGAPILDVSRSHTTTQHSR